MADKFIKKTVAAEGVTLSNMVWALIKRQPIGYIETVLTSNPGLAALGAIIPIGTVVLFPIIDISEEETVVEVVRLYD